MSHPNARSLANLRPAKKGETRNPNGRPSLKFGLLKCIAAELSKLSANGVETNEQVIASVLVKMAAQGNVKAIELAMEYTAMKPAQAVNLGGVGTPVTIKVVYDKPDAK